MWNKQAWLAVFVLIFFLGSLFINYQASAGLLTDKGVGEVSREYELPITPASWTFSIWAIIYTWQGFWQILMIVLACKYGEFLKQKHIIILGSLFYVTYMFVCVLNALWIIVWCQEQIVGAGIALVLIAVSLYICGYLSHNYLLKEIPKMLSTYMISYSSMDYNDGARINDDILKNKNIQYLLYFGVLNGIAIYATWVTIATCLNLGIIAAYKNDVSVNTASNIMLTVLTIIIFIYWSLDFVFFRKYLRYTFTPYFVLIFAFLGVITNDYPFDSPKIYVTVLLILACLGSIAKIIMSFFTWKNDSYQSQI